MNYKDADQKAQMQIACLHVAKKIFSRHGEEVALQHQLLVCDMMIDMPPQIKCRFTPHPKVWKLKDPQTCS